MSSQDKKRGDNVASPRSRKKGQMEQDKMTAQVTELMGRLSEILGKDFVQLEVEPVIKKINKKKLN
jgi:hypothetical protein|tara:strand:+ start:10080 stop:10277 length:198 start_codon:yes stop_codon:yes gene_type:complete